MSSIETIASAPAGHETCTIAGVVHTCQCGVVRMSRSALNRHHEDVRAERNNLAVEASRMRQLIPTIAIDHADPRDVIGIPKAGNS